MIKVVQFGEGNFLRTFADAYFDSLNKEKISNFRVNIVKPIPQGSLSKFVNQKNKYNIVLRGFKDGKEIEDVYHIDCLESVFSPFENKDLFYNLAYDPDVKIVVSNTTEAGIVYNENDKYTDCEGITFPARLTKFLHRRFLEGLDGLYFMPVELIENNADELYKCVDKYITLWGLGENFRKWNNEECYYCNTLVDRVVSGYPRDEKVKQHLWELIGENDELVSVGEPFGLWAVEDKGNIKDYIVEGHHNIDVIITKNIAYYKKRKVRILNGSHTNLVPICLWLGKENVYDCLVDEKTKQFIYNSLEEIIPFVSDNLDETRAYANAVMERFLNPFINHQLTSILLNSVSKWRARDLPTFKDYFAKNHAIPEYLSIGFTYLVNLYKRIYKKDDAYFVDLLNRTIEIKDDLANLTYFISGKTTKEFMSDTSLWGEDLTKYDGFYNKVVDGLKSIDEGKELI